MESPETPTIDPSEPELESAFVRELLDKIGDEAMMLVNVEMVGAMLNSAGLSVDEDGFIIDKESGERVEPWLYDRYAFKEIESPVDDPLSDYCRPESEVESMVGIAREEIHLSDLHTVYPIDGTPRPIRDDEMLLQYQLIEVGATYPTITEWSDAREPLLDELDVVPVTSSGALPGDTQGDDIELSCLGCQFTGQIREWENSDDVLTPLYCPKCSVQWDTYGCMECTACGAENWWEDYNHEESGAYWEPYCTECGADHSQLEKRDRYNRE